MRQGFSLVELSIVLVILGLLTGGILTGQNLIRAAELRSITTEYNNYKTAINTFRDKYFAIPGDMVNATEFWGNVDVVSGDGSGELDVAGSAGATGERYAFWEHLSRAGMVEGDYTGLAGAGGADDSIIAVNVPKAKFGNAGWSATFLGTVDLADVVYYEGAYQHQFVFGAKQTGDLTIDPVLTPEEAWNIDSKIDDQEPGTGAVRVPEELGSASAAACTDQDAAGTALANVADYQLTVSSVQCALVMTMF